jgi:hypothetical protein
LRWVRKKLQPELADNGIEAAIAKWQRLTVRRYSNK